VNIIGFHCSVKHHNFVHVKLLWKMVFRTFELKKMVLLHKSVEDKWL